VKENLLNAIPFVAYKFPARKKDPNDKWPWFPISREYKNKDFYFLKHLTALVAY
jgi:hypothetical protein